MSTVRKSFIDKKIESGNYDSNLISSEVARRQEREGEEFKQLPTPSEEEQESDLDTTGGYTMSREGLLNNYAVEPEMYYETPGDRTEMIEEQKEARRQELQEVNETDEDGKLTTEGDSRGKGVGII